MNHRELPQVPQGMCRAAPCVALLLTTLAPATLLATARPHPMTAPTESYLTTLGAPPLRFVEEPPAPEPRVATLEPVRPPKAPTSRQHPVSSAPHVVAATPAVSEASPAAGTETKASTPADKTDAPLSILPDEIRPQVRAEDFIPYFQIPGSRGRQPSDVTVIVPLPPNPPAAAPQAASSATYTQTQK